MDRQLKRLPLLLCVVGVVLAGCTSLKRYQPLPQNLESQVEMPGFHNVRAWADAPSPGLEKSAKEALVQEKVANHGRYLPEMSVLALSGGGSDGAFGAGLMCGWTKAGTRPNFKVVTGISTGALMAPFVFLGPSYDARLEKLYTTISDDTIYKRYSLFSIFTSIINLQSLPSMATNEPLEALIKREVTMEMMHEIAREHKKGRRLLVGTTQFNAQRLVIWNMGEIALAGTQDALKLFHQVMMASSSLPVTFPPQFIKVSADNKMFDEMHVDGGVETQVMLYENAIVPFAQAAKKGGRIERPRKLYVVRNEKIYPEWANVQPTLKAIAVRTIDSMIKSQGVGDLYRLYLYSLRDDIEYNLAFIPPEFLETEKSPFDNAYMRKVFALGYKLGKQDKSWRHYPPDFDPE